MVQELSRDRVPPQNLEAEASVLGAILLENEALVKALEVLRPNHFYREAHRKIFSAALTLFERNEPVDLVTLANELEKRKELSEVGGPSYLASLIDAVPTAANVYYHAKIVREKALLRDMIRVATDLVASGYTEGEDVDTLLDRAEHKIFEIAQDRITRSFVSMHEIIKDTFKLVENLHRRESRVTGVPSGFTEFDDMTGGFQPGDMIIVAGRPSMGKTSFCLNLARNAAVMERIPVSIFSLEMSIHQVVMRMLCTEARVDSWRVRTGRLYDKDWPKLTMAAGILHDAPIFVDDTPGITVLEMRAKARRLKAERGLGLVLVDYLQMIRPRGRAENRQQEIAQISLSLKDMAKELNVPVVAVSQLSRAVEAREDRRPRLSDLRESGAIEQDADLVVFLYRPGFYETQKRADSKSGRHRHGLQQEKGFSQEEGEEEEEFSDFGERDYTVEVHIAKQRNGPTGTIKLAFKREYTRFEPLDEFRSDFQPSL